MDAQRFEITMEKFFQKASVSLLKKGKDYAGYDEAPSYLLIDVKRNAFYLTETDTPSETLPDMETTALATSFSEQAGLTAETAGAIIRLGRAVDSFDGSLAVPGADLKNFSRKSALVISELNAKDSAAYLKSLGANFQTAPFKGAFAALFLDNDSSEKLAGLYRESARNETGRETGESKAPDEPSEAESGIKEYDEGIDEALDKIDLSFLSASGATETIPEEAEEELYTKILNDRAENAANASAPGSKFLDAEETGDIKRDTETCENTASTQKEITNGPKSESTGHGLGAAAVAANVSGLVFFTPYYLLGKLTSRVLPPFVIYWLGAIAVILGFYRLVWSSAGVLIYGWATSSALQTASFSAQAINNISMGAGASDSACLMLLGYSVAFFGGQAASLGNMANGWILGYGASFAAVLTIFPHVRQWGLRLTVWLVIVFLAFPFIIRLEEKLLSRFTEAALFAAETGSYTSLSAASTGAFFSAAALPVLLLCLTYALACGLVPDKTVFKKVLP